MKALLALVAMTAVAHADASRDVEKLVRGFLTHAGDQKQLQPLLRDDAVLVVDVTHTLNAHAESPDYLKQIVIKKVDSVTVHVDDATHAAWFKGVIDGLIDDPTGDSCHSGGTCPPSYEAKLHISGLAIDDKGWKLQAIFISKTMSDAEYLKAHSWGSASDAVPKKLEEKGDKDLLAAAKTWIAGGFAAAAASGALYAQGTALAEVGVDAKAKKLASTWDKLELWPSKLDVATFGSYGIVFANLGWPVKGRNDLQLRLAAIAVKDHGTWKWLVLDFG